MATGAGNHLARFQLANLMQSEPLKNYSSDYSKLKHHQTIRQLYEQAYQSGIKKAELPLAFYYISDDVPNDKQQWAFEIN